MRLRLGLAALLLGTLAFTLVATPAEACGRRGQRGGGGYASASPVYYSTPTYSQPMYYGSPYSQPMYGQQMYGQPMYGPSVPYPPSSSPQRMPATPTATASVTVSIGDDKFDPGTVTVAPGTTVKWVNNGQHKHTVTADKGEWDSGDMTAGATYTATFNTPGTFTYNCRYHKDMKGTIVVTAPSSGK